MANNTIKDDWQDVPLNNQVDDWQDITDESNSEEWKSKASDIPSLDELKAGLAGAAESFTFGAAPEIAGGVQALASSTFGDNKYSDLLETYKKYEAEREKDFRDLEKESPSAYLTGEIAGGVGQAALSGIATGGLSTAASLAQGGAKLPMLMNAAKLAGIGAGTGALTGAGYSKESVIDALSGDSDAQAGLAKDIGIGAGLGAASNVVAPIIGKGLGKGAEIVGKGAGKLADFGGKAIGKVSDAAKNIDTYKDLKSAYDFMRKGIRVSGDIGKEMLETDSMDVAEQIVKGLKKQTSTGSNMIGDVLKKFEGKSQDVSKIIKEAKDLINKSTTMLKEDKERQLALISQFEDSITKETIESGKDIATKDLQRKMRIEEASAPMFGEKVSFPDIKETPDAFIAMRKKINKEGFEEVSPLVQSIPEDRIFTTTTQELRDMDLQDLYTHRSAINDSYNKSDYGAQQYIKEQTKLIDALIDSKSTDADKLLIKEGKSLMADAYKGADEFKLFDKNASDEFKTIDLQSTLLGKDDSRSIKHLKESLKYGRDEYIPTELKTEALNIIPERSRLHKTASGQSINPGVTVGRIAGSVGATSVKVGELLGAGRNLADKVVKKLPREFTRGILNTSEDGLYKMATKLPTEFAESMINALKDTTKKDRLLWALAQQPAFREAVNKIEEDEINNMSETLGQ